MNSLERGRFLSPNALRWAWGQRIIRKFPAPAEGAEFSFTCLGSQLTRIISLTAQLTTAAEATSRVPQLAVKDGDENTLMLLPGSNEIAESLTRRVTFAVEAAQNAAAGASSLVVAIPELLLLPGYSIATITASIKTKDKWGPFNLWVEEFEESPDHPLAELLELADKFQDIGAVLHGSAG